MTSGDLDDIIHVNIMGPWLFIHDCDGAWGKYFWIILTEKTQKLKTKPIPNPVGASGQAVRRPTSSANTYIPNPNYMPLRYDN